MAAEKPRVVVLGAGVGGLAAGWFLARTGRYDVTVVERAREIGGHCASFRHGEFILDHGPHKMYSVIPGVLKELRALLGDRLLTHQKRNAIYLCGHRLDYPLRLGNMAQALGLGRALRLGWGYGQAIVGRMVHDRPSLSYAQHMRARFGAAAYQLVFEPLAWKVWGDPETLHVDIAKARVPSSGATEVILKLLRLQQDDAQTNAAFFHYPRRGFGEFPQAMAEQIERHGGRIVTDTTPVGLTVTHHRATSVQVQGPGGAGSLPCEYLVSSIPLTTLGRLAYGEGEPEFTRAVASLQYRHLCLVYLVLNRPRLLEDHWAFFPERDYVFSRIFEQKAMSEELGPPDRTVVCCDFTCSEGDGLWQSSDQHLADQCIEGLLRAKVLADREEVGGWLVKRSRHFYPRYDLAYHDTMRVVSGFLQRIENLLCTGRIGMYNYNNSDHCVDMGRFIAQQLSDGLPCPQIWRALEARVASYQIID